MQSIWESLASSLKWKLLNQISLLLFPMKYSWSSVFLAEENVGHPDMIWRMYTCHGRRLLCRSWLYPRFLPSHHSVKLRLWFTLIKSYPPTVISVESVSWTPTSISWLNVTSARSTTTWAAWTHHWPVCPRSLAPADGKHETSFSLCYLINIQSYFFSYPDQGLVQIGLLSLWLNTSKGLSWGDL